MDHRNSLRTSLNTSRGISFGAIITLITVILAEMIITFWFYILLPIIFVVIYFTIIQNKLNNQIEKVDIFCNYIQVVLRKFTFKANPEKLFIPFSFVFNFIKGKEYRLKDCLKQFNDANIKDYLEYRIVPRKTDWSIVFQIVIISITSIGFIIVIVYMMITGSQPGGVPSEFFDFLGWLTIITLFVVSIAVLNYFVIDYILYKKRKEKKQRNNEFSKEPY